MPLSTATRQYIYSQTETLGLDYDTSPPVSSSSDYETIVQYQATSTPVETPVSTIVEQLTTLEPENVEQLTTLELENVSVLDKAPDRLESTILPFLTTTAPSVQTTTASPVRATPDWKISTKYPHFYPKYRSSTTQKPLVTPRFNGFDWLYCPTYPTSKPSPRTTTLISTQPTVSEATFSLALEKNSSTNETDVSTSVLIGIGMAIGN